MRAWPAAVVREAEAGVLATVPDGVLMQRAAAALAVVCAGLLRERPGRVTGSRIVLLVGSGNNGGDALWAGERLARRGAAVTGLLLAGTAHEAGSRALLAAGGRLVRVSGTDRAPAVPEGAAGGLITGPAATGAPAAARDLLATADLVLDGIAGLGAAPGLREPARSLLAGLDLAGRTVAVDLPSGLDPDSGALPATFLPASVTVTFGAPKPCLLLPPAAARAGDVVPVGLGLDLPPEAAAAVRVGAPEAADAWPVPGAGDDKYSRGVLGVVAGSTTYPGAAVLAVDAAVRAGVGMVRYVGPAPVAEQVRARRPEVVAGEGRVQAWLVGPGVDGGGDAGADPDPDLASGGGQLQAVRRALVSGLPCVVDAGALPEAVAVLSRPGRAGGATPGSASRYLLTPHAGELARLLGRLRGSEVAREDVAADPASAGRELARALDVTVLVKGATTVVVGPDGPATVVAEAPAWLATAGAGDVLAGIAGALLAAGLDAAAAGATAATVHGLAARRASGATDGAAGGPIAAADVAEAVPATVAELLDVRERRRPARR